MAKSKPTAEEKVLEYISSLDATEQELLYYLKDFVLCINSTILPHIKWNSLSFYYNGELEDFDPKTYQRDLLVCNLHRGKILIIFPTGAGLKDQLKGKDYPDGRKIITVDDLDDLRQKSPSLKTLIEDWLGKIE
jgi:hypothetical protein